MKGPFFFLHVNLLDNRSEFQAPLSVALAKEGDDYVGEVQGAVAIANTIAFISECIDPVSIFIGLTRRDLMGQAVRYLFFGEGETGLMVYTILTRYWDWTPEDDVRPLIFLMSGPEASREEGRRGAPNGRERGGRAGRGGARAQRRPVLATLEAVTGSLYVAILIVRLVSQAVVSPGPGRDGPV
ncbi:MAG: hypothetical protein U0599_27655 [Vicinamibacteria bacterium]